MELPARYSRLSSAKRKLVRQEYVRLQDGKCFYCKQDLSSPPPQSITDKVINWDLFPPDFLRYPVHLQHDHDTDLTEGAVHSYCNAVMWQYEHR